MTVPVDADFIHDCCLGVAEVLSDSNLYCLTFFRKDGRKHQPVAIYTVQGDIGSVTVVADWVKYAPVPDRTIQVQYHRDYNQYQASVMVLVQPETDPNEWLFYITVDEEHAVLVGFRYGFSFSQSEVLFCTDAIATDRDAQKVALRIAGPELLVQLVEADRGSKLTATEQLDLVGVASIRE